MSKQLVHILHHGSKLGKNRGMMVCTIGEDQKELPIEDIRAVIIAARGVFVSPELIGALMEAGAIILYCDHSYKPVGVASGIERIIKPEIIYHQANPDLKLHEHLWRKIVAAKVANQAKVLELCGVNSKELRFALANGSPDEADCARRYWGEYFAFFGLNGVVRRGDDEEGVNAKLNYGYAVLGALVHRSVLAHGLSPVLGMHHVARYDAHAMVYDLMEPWRPYVDLALARFENKYPGTGKDIESWARHIAGSLKDTKVKTPAQTLFLLDALDVFVSGAAKCYAEKTSTHLWTPLL